jgi:hypothetical protein
MDNYENFNKNKKVRRRQTVFFNHNGMKLKPHNRKEFRKFTNI